MPPSNVVVLGTPPRASTEDVIDLVTPTPPRPSSSTDEPPRKRRRRVESPTAEPIIIVDDDEESSRPSHISQPTPPPQHHHHHHQHQQQQQQQQQQPPQFEPIIIPDDTPTSHSSPSPPTPARTAPRVPPPRASLPSLMHLISPPFSTPLSHVRMSRTRGAHPRAASARFPFPPLRPAQPCTTEQLPSVTPAPFAISDADLDRSEHFLATPSQQLRHSYPIDLVSMSLDRTSQQAQPPRQLRPTQQPRPIQLARPTLSSRLSQPQSNHTLDSIVPNVSSRSAYRPSSSAQVDTSPLHVEIAAEATAAPRASPPALSAPRSEPSRAHFAADIVRMLDSTSPSRRGNGAGSSRSTVTTPPAHSRFDFRNALMRSAALRPSTLRSSSLRQGSSRPTSSRLAALRATNRARANRQSHSIAARVAASVSGSLRNAAHTSEFLGHPAYLFVDGNASRFEFAVYQQLPDRALDYDQLIRLDEHLLREKNRADKDQIEAIPVVKAVQKDEDIRCCICMCDVEAGEELRVLPCDHKYHKACIDEWLTYNGCCPVDKKRIAPKRSRRRPS